MYNKLSSKTNKTNNNKIIQLSNDFNLQKKLPNFQETILGWYCTLLFPKF